MSEAINTKPGVGNFHRLLLTSVSALALLSLVHIRAAHASDDGDSSPPVWIELGGMFDRVSASQTPFVPPFAAGPQPSFAPISSIDIQKPPSNSFGAEGAVRFQPEGSDWVFSASVRYGRSLSAKDVKQQPVIPTPKAKIFTFFNTTVRNTESHAIADFQVGRDVGLGMLGRNESTFSLGIRFAQFATRSNFSINENPNGFYYNPQGGGLGYGTYNGKSHSERDFHGLGPSISWNASLPFAGDRDGQLSLDWGAKAAILFGRQKANVQHQTAEILHNNGSTYVYHMSTAHSRARTVTVPNFDGFATISYRLQILEIKLGYRADFYFGAMDGGLDTARRVDRGFYGPFLNVAVGIGG